MGSTQDSFLDEFKRAFNKMAGRELDWHGGQATENCAAFKIDYPDIRRKIGITGPEIFRNLERFELGDATTSYSGWKIIVEFESKELPLSNILKYWPYLRGELNIIPVQPILICHFSDWWSYKTRRELWAWTLSRMENDQGRLVEIKGKQFDHGGADIRLRAISISSAIEWINSTVGIDHRFVQSSQTYLEHSVMSDSFQTDVPPSGQDRPMGEQTDAQAPQPDKMRDPCEENTSATVPGKNYKYGCPMLEIPYRAVCKLVRSGRLATLHNIRQEIISERPDDGMEYCRKNIPPDLYAQTVNSKSRTSYPASNKKEYDRLFGVKNERGRIEHYVLYEKNKHGVWENGEHVHPGSA